MNQWKKMTALSLSAMMVIASIGANTPIFQWQSDTVYAESANTVSVTEDGRFTIEDGKLKSYNVTSEAVVVIPDGVKSINGSVFKSHKEIEEVVMPEGLEEIGDNAFAYCSNLKKVTFPDTLKLVRRYAFEKCRSLKEVVLPEGTKGIGYAAFDGCTALERVVIPDTVESFTKEYNEGYYSNAYGDYDDYEPESLFCNCTSLQEVTLPSNMYAIPNSMFRGCSSLKSITIPDGVVKINSRAFEKCSALEEVSIPESVSEFGVDVFTNTKWLSNQRKSNPLVIVNDILIDGKRTTDKEVVIPDGVQSIAPGAFEKNSLTSVSIPDSVMSIGNFAFRDCAKLESVKLSSALEQMGDDVFSGTALFSQLKSESADGIIVKDGVLLRIIATEGEITIPTGVSVVADGICGSTSKFTKVTFPDTVQHIGKESFVSFAGTSPSPYVDAFVGNSPAVKEYAKKYGITYMRKDSIFTDNYELLTLLVEQHADLNNDGDVSVDELEALSSIELNKKVSLKQLEYAKNLKSLYINSSEYEDLEDICQAGLTGVESLRISSTTFGDASGLEMFQNLKYLQLYKCTALCQLPQLRTLTKLETISCPGCSNLESVTLPEGLTSIDYYGFAKCTSLQTIQLPSTLTNISYGAFYGCTGIEQLEIPEGVTQIQFGTFKDCSKLGELGLTENIIQIGYQAFEGCSSLDIMETLKPCKNLEILDLSRMELADISGLADLTKLKELTLYQNHLNDISALQSCTQLEKLNLNRNFIKDASPVAVCTQLKELEICGNKIQNVDFLKNMTELEILNLGENQITDVSALTFCSKLQELSLYTNQITDVTSMAALTNLEYVDLQDNSLSDFKQLQELKKNGVQHLYIKNNAFAENDKADCLFQFEKEIEVVVGKTAKLGLFNQITSETMTDLGFTKDEIKTVSKKAEVATIGFDGTNIQIKGVSAGTTTVSVSYKDSIRNIKVTVVDTIKRGENSKKVLPKLELASAQTAVLNCNGESVWAVTDGRVSKVSDLPEGVVQYEPQVVRYNLRTADYQDDKKVNCFVLNEDNRLWKCSDNTEEKLGEDVVCFSAGDIISGRNEEEAYLTSVSSGKILWGSENTLIKNQKDGKLAELKYWQTTSPLSGYRTESGLYLNQTIYLSNGNYSMTCFSNIKKIINGSFTTWYTAVNGTTKAEGFEYSLDISDNKSIRVYDQVVGANVSKRYMATAEYGWCYINYAGELIPSENETEGHNFKLRRNGDLYVNGEFALSGVDNAVDVYDEDGFEDATVYAVRKDGTLWKIEAEETGLMPEYVCSLERILEEAPEDPDYEEKPEMSESPQVSQTPIMSEAVKASETPAVSESTKASETPQTGEEVQASRFPQASMLPIVSTAPDEEKNIVPGDADGNGELTLSDAQLVLKAALRIIPVSAINEKAVDVDGNPGIGLSDAQLVLKAALKIIVLPQNSDSVIGQQKIAFWQVIQIAEAVNK